MYFGIDKSVNYTMETWKTIEGFENYQVSNLGRVKSIARIKNKIYQGKYNGLVVPQFYPEKILKQRLNNKGYYDVNIYHEGKMETQRVHRLVAQAFIGNPEKEATVNHIDSNKLNNRIDNLEWCSMEYNVLHARNKGLIQVPKGSASHNAKLKEDDVIEIRALSEQYRISQKKLGILFGVSSGTIQDLIQRKTWRHI